jgi:GGDEF domain-containing protein
MKRVSDKVSHLNLFESDKFDFSISYGFSEYGGNNEITVENLLNEADHQMYLNKKAIKAMSKVLII